jgi:hypothetical protein
MCKPYEFHSHGGSSCCCCCGPSTLQRHFISKKEETKMLEEYKDAIEKELEGLTERLKEIKGK